MALAPRHHGPEDLALAVHPDELTQTRAGAQRIDQRAVGRHTRVGTVRVQKERIPGELQALRGEGGRPDARVVGPSEVDQVWHLA